MFYVFHGEDTHSQQETLDQLKKKLGPADMLSLNTTKLEGRGLTVARLRDACNIMPFLSPKRLIIVEGFLSQKLPKKESTELLTYLAEMPDSARLVFLEKKGLSTKHVVLKLAQDDKDKGYVRLFERPKGAKLEGWVKNRVVQKGGKIHPRAAQLLAQNVGSDLQVLDNELEKLVLYKGVMGNSEEREQITAADVQRLSPYAAEANMFDLVDALGNRNGRLAAQLLQQKLAEGAEPFLVFSMVIRQFRLLLQVKELLGEGGNPAAVSKALRIHSFVAGKLCQQSNRFTLDLLEQIYHKLLQIDVDVKTGQNDLVTALNMLIFVLG